MSLAMDVHLLDKALNCYGSSLLHQLEAEHGDAAVIPVALRRKYSGIATVNKDFWSSEDKEYGYQTLLQFVIMLIFLLA